MDRGSGLRPRLAPGFSVLADRGAIWLVAGEDLRFRIGADAWLAELLRRCDGATSIAALAELAPPEHRAEVAPLLEQLVGERVLVEGTPVQAHVASSAIEVVGSGDVARALAAAWPASSGAITAFVQDRMDHAALLAFNADALARGRRWMWITTGPAQRAYVGPLFVPDAGPCAACVLLHFKRLSPVPDLHDVLIARGGDTVAANVDDAMLATVAAVARWKLALVAEPVARAALYALHVVEASDLTVTSHAPIADPECTACRAR